MVYAKRSLSQNFLVDPNIRRKLVTELGADPGDAVLEVGPGHGELSDVQGLRDGGVAALVTWMKRLFFLSSSIVRTPQYPMPDRSPPMSW